MSLLTRTLIGASIPFALIIAYIVSSEQPTTTSIPLLDIGIEHTQPMTLSMTLTYNDNKRIVDIGNDTKEEIAISVPENWKRSEVRNATLAQVMSDAPSFGYIRWHLPAKASVVFGTKQPFDQLNVHNPSSVVLNISMTTVDLQKNSGDHQVYLVKEGAVKIP
jgi:hypothetical protein